MAMNMKESLPFQNSQSFRKKMYRCQLCVLEWFLTQTRANLSTHMWGRDITVIESPPCARNVDLLNIYHE